MDARDLCAVPTCHSRVLLSPEPLGEQGPSMPSEGLADPSGWLAGHVAPVAWRGRCLCFGVGGESGSTGRDSGSAFVSLGLLVFRGLWPCQAPTTGHQQEGGAWLSRKEAGLCTGCWEVQAWGPEEAPLSQPRPGAHSAAGVIT